ncbi:MAG: TOMM precursor leader peptide-binding protein [Nocardioidaceae bacterium]
MHPIVQQPLRPVLRPGTHVLTRADGSLQIGIDPRHALRLTPSTRVLATLDRLGSPAECDGVAADPDLLALLDRHGLLVAETQLHRSAAPTRLRVDVRGFGHAASRLLVEEVRRQLDRAALSCEGRDDRDGVVGVLCGVGEPDRILADPWTRDGTAYLLVRLREGHVLLGPFVQPGRTACLRCVDAHLTDLDASWPVLVHQYAVASSRDRPDGATEPVDPLLVGLAAAWAARDLATYVAGRRPATWSTTIRIEPELAAFETQRWLRHPDCGCSP